MEKHSRSCEDVFETKMIQFFIEDIFFLQVYFHSKSTIRKLELESKDFICPVREIFVDFLIYAEEN